MLRQQSTLIQAGFINYENVFAETKQGQLISVDIYLVDRTRFIQCNVRDITERKQAREALKKAHDELDRRVEERTIELSGLNNELETEIELRKRTEEALRESEWKFRGIFNETFQFIVLLTLHGTIIEVNRSALAFGGIEGPEVIGKPFWETVWWIHSAELQEELRSSVRKAAKGEFLRYEVTHQATDGSLHNMDFSLKPVIDEAGNIILLIAEGRDITDRKQAEEALRKAYDELEEKVRERTSELYNANIALRVLLKQREEDKNELEEKILSNVRELIMPLIDELKKMGLSSKYRSYLGLLESNLLEIISPFSIKLSSKYANLTNKEILLADFIKRGKSTKEIAGILDVSKGTIDSHRNNIRKKLGLTGTKTNLRTYLSSII